MPNQILTLGALAGAPQRRNMPPEAVRELWAQGQQGMQQEVLPTSLWDIAVNNPVSQYLGEAIGTGVQKVREALPENWQNAALLTLPLLTGMARGPSYIKWAIDPRTKKVIFERASEKFGDLKYDRHVDWFENIGLPSTGAEFDAIPRGNVVTDAGPAGREIIDFDAKGAYGKGPMGEYQDARRFYGQVFDAMQKKGYLGRKKKQ